MAESELTDELSGPTGSPLETGLEADVLSASTVPSGVQSDAVRSLLESRPPEPVDPAEFEERGNLRVPGETTAPPVGEEPDLSQLINDYHGQLSLIGGAGEDVLEGGPADERIEGRGGNDTITGGDGDDLILGDRPDNAPAGPDYDTLVQSRDAVAFFRFDEGSGSSAGDAMRGNNGSLKNGASFVSDHAYPGSSGAVAFDGSNDYLEIPHNNAYRLDEGYLQFWFKPDGLSGNQTLLSKDAYGYGSGGHFEVSVSQNGTITVSLQSSSRAYSISSGSGAAGNGEWTHVVFGWGDDGMKLYVDGALVDANSYGGGLENNGEALIVGASARYNNVVFPIFTDYFDGRIDALSIHQGAIDNETAATFYQSTGNTAEVPGDDLLYGEDGDDTVIGGAGNDTLYGGAGDDLLAGQDGDDLLVGDSLGGGTATRTVVNADFSSGTGGFGYQDDAFGTNQPGYASGSTSAGALHVDLGGINGTDINNMSGGWTTGFSLDGDASGGVLTFRYRLNAASAYDSDEFSAVLVSIDGQLVGVNGNEYVALVTGGGDTGWKTVTINLDALGAGQHTLTIGGFNNRKTDANESTRISIDDVTLNYDVVTPELTEGGNDTLIGGAGNDTLEGNGGNDSLYGGTGDDSLYGGAGDDALSGGDGNDLIEGNGGDDSLIGGAGDDLLYGDGGTGSGVPDGGGPDGGESGGGGEGFPADLFPTFSHAVSNMVFYLVDGNGHIIKVKVDDFDKGPEVHDPDDLPIAGFLATEYPGYELIAATVKAGNNKDPDVANGEGKLIIFDDSYGRGDLPLSKKGYEEYSYKTTLGSDRYDEADAAARQGGGGDGGSGGGGGGGDVGPDLGLPGNDVIEGGDGNDTIFGNEEHDTLFGGAGDDLIYGDGLSSGGSTGGGAQDTGARAAGNGLAGEIYYGLNGWNLAKVWQLIGSKGPDATFTVSELDYPQNGDTIDGTTGAWLGQDKGTLSGNPSADFTSLAILIQGWIYIPAGTHDFTVWSDDGFQLKIGDQVFSQFDSDRGFAETTASGTFEEGFYRFELVYWEHGGSAGLEVSSSISGGQPLDDSWFYKSLDDTGLDLAWVDDGNGTGHYVPAPGSGGASAGAPGNDVIEGGDGNDTIFGNEAHDTLYGGAGDDLIYGDIPSQGSGPGGTNDELVFSSDFEEGDEDFERAPFDGWSSHDGKVEIRFGEGVNGSDAIELNEDPGNHFPDARDIYRDLTTEAGATYTLDFQYAARPGYNGSVTKFQVLIDGQVVGTFSPDGTGNSQPVYESGSITFTGTGGVQRISFVAVGVDVDEGRGAFLDDITLTKNGSAGSAAGQPGRDLLFGGEGDDTLVGNEDDDTLDGGTGDDVLIGDGGLVGADTVSGRIDASNFQQYASGADSFTGASAPVIWIDSSFGNGFGVKPGQSSNIPVQAETGFNPETYRSEALTVAFGRGITTATVELTAFFADDSGHAEVARWEAYRNGELIAAGVHQQTSGGTATLEIDLGGQLFDTLVFSAETYNRSYENEGVTNDSSDFLISRIDWTAPVGSEQPGFGEAAGAPGDDTLTGGDGNDRLFGNQGNDVLDGGNGDDLLSGGAGDDFLDGWFGSDTVIGGSGDDTIMWDSADAYIRGGSGHDTLVGYEGDDWIFLDDAMFGMGEVANGGFEVIDLGNGDNFLVGDAINQGDTSLTVYGGNGNDWISTWGNGDDLIYGGGGTLDQIWGGAGNDVIYGGAGVDYIYGGAGNDTLIGGEGYDVFYVGRGDGHTEIIDDAGPSDFFGETRDGNGLVLFWGYNDFGRYEGVGSEGDSFALGETLTDARQVSVSYDDASQRVLVRILDGLDAGNSQDATVSFDYGAITALNFWDVAGGGTLPYEPWSGERDITRFEWDAENHRFVFQGLDLGV